MAIKLLEGIGKFLVIFSFIIIVVGLVLLATGQWKLKDGWPPELERQTSSGLTEQPITALPSITGTQYSSGISVTSTTTFVPLNDYWSVEGSGDVISARDYVIIQAADKTNVFTRKNEYHNLIVKLIVKVKRIDINGNYSLILRRVDPCQLYNFIFSNKDNSLLKVELYKHDCDKGPVLLNQAEIPVNIYNPHKLSVGIEGGNTVNFFVAVNDVDVFKIEDPEDFIWRGGFGLGVENGEVEFLDIELNE